MSAAPLMAAAAPAPLLVASELFGPLRVAPEDKRVLGNRRMISLWPARSGVLVE